MSGTYLTDLDDVLRSAGCNVGEIDGWQSRARGSGGYHAGVWCVMWHHTASAGDGYEDALYCAHYSDVAPVCNVTIGQDGVVWIVAAGCTNTNGSGGPLTLPDGRTVPLDDMNRYAFGVEISNGGTGMPYPQAQIDAAFRVSNAIAGRYISGRSTNCALHVSWAPGRKIDPATAAAVGGPWEPRSTNSSGSWNLDDVRAECSRRAGSQPPSSSSVALLEGDGMHYYFKPQNEASGSTVWGSDGTQKWAFHSGSQLDHDRFFQEARLQACGMSPADAKAFSAVMTLSKEGFYAMGLNIDPSMTGRDPWGWKT